MPNQIVRSALADIGNIAGECDAQMLISAGGTSLAQSHSASALGANSFNVKSEPLERNGSMHAASSDAPLMDVLGLVGGEAHAMDLVPADAELGLMPGLTLPGLLGQGPLDDVALDDAGPPYGLLQDPDFARMLAEATTDPGLPPGAGAPMPAASLPPPLPLGLGAAGSSPTFAASNALALQWADTSNTPNMHMIHWAIATRKIRICARITLQSSWRATTANYASVSQYARPCVPCPTLSSRTCALPSAQPPPPATPPLPAAITPQYSPACSLASHPSLFVLRFHLYHSLYIKHVVRLSRQPLLPKLPPFLLHTYGYCMYLFEYNISFALISHKS